MTKYYVVFRLVNQGDVNAHIIGIFLSEGKALTEAYKRTKPGKKYKVAIIRREEDLARLDDLLGEE